MKRILLLIILLISSLYLGYTNLINIGLGLNLGVPIGFKIRILLQPSDIFIIGIDADATHALFAYFITGSILVGFTNETNKDIRMYFIAGSGFGHITQLFMGSYDGIIIHVGLGLEKKFGKDFGFGGEGGYNFAIEDEGFPFIRFTCIWYIL